MGLHPPSALASIFLFLTAYCNAAAETWNDYIATKSVVEAYAAKNNMYELPTMESSGVDAMSL